MEVAVGVGIVVVFAAAVAVVGIRLGMLLAPRLDRLTAETDEDAPQAADGVDDRADDRSDVHH